LRTPFKKTNVFLKSDFIYISLFFLFSVGPAFASKGNVGQEIWLELELKTIADAGLVGFPNAGKSTFLAAISNAHPKIAPYPFTTLNPYIGTIDYPDLVSIRVADIPGIIQGAHQNIGLGHSFLRHIERCRVLVYVIDLASNEPWNDLETLKFELEAYKKGLTLKPSIIIANKADIIEIAKPNLKKLQEMYINIPCIPVSAKNKQNILKATTFIRRTLTENVEKIN